MTDACPTTDVPCQPIDVHAAQRMFPVVVGHLALEDDVEQVAGLGEHGTVEIGGVGDLDHELADRHRDRH